VEEGEAEVGERGGPGGVVGGMRRLAGGGGEEGGEVLLQLVVRVGGARVLHCHGRRAVNRVGRCAPLAARHGEEAAESRASPSSFVEHPVNRTVQINDRLDTSKSRNGLWGAGCPAQLAKNSS
jgi:hypothetical protein